MAQKKASPKNDKGFEESLWDSANRLRGSVESSEYKHVVLSLIFLKFVSDKFEERRAELIAEGKEKYINMVEFYTMKNVFYLPETSRWSYIQQHAKQGDIAIKIDSALTADGSKLSALIDAINNIDTVRDKEEDVVGRVYEYFLGKFAAIAKTYHAWRGEVKDGVYEDQAGYCKSVTLEEMRKHDFVLTPGRYVGAAALEDDGIPFETKMTEMSQTLYGQMEESAKLDDVIKENLKQLGY